MATALVIADPATASVRVAGLSQAARTVLSLRRAGLERAAVRATGERAAIEALLGAEAQGFPVDWVDAPASNGEGTLLVLDTAHVRDLPDPARVAAGDAVVFYEDAGLVACPPSRAEALRPLLAGAGGVAEVADRAQAAGVPVERKKADFFAHPVADPAAAERALVRTLRKASDGPISRNFDRKVSGLISRGLVRTPLSPNQITIIASLVGLGGAVLLGLGGYWACVIGAALFVLSTILDGCDGEVARLKFRESAFGYHLDLVLDNVVYVGVFIGIAVGLARIHPGTHPLWACAAMIEGIVVNSSIMYFLVLRKGLTEKIPMLRVFERIANGDFSYIVLAFALAGRLDGFLWGSAVGVHVFYIALLSCLAWLKSHPHEAARSEAAALPVVVDARGPGAGLRVGGTPVATRLLRAARIAGARAGAVVGEARLGQDAYAPNAVEVASLSAPVLLADGALIVDPRILETMIAHGAPCRVATPGEGVRLACLDAAAWEAWRRDGRLDPAALPLLDLTTIKTYSFEQRAEVPVYVEEAVSQGQCDAVTERLLTATQKKVLDLPSEFIDPPFENAITRALVNTPITPNHVTLFCAAVAAVIAVLFWQGWLWGGVVATYLVEWLDGVDGKLARLRLQFSELGKNESTVDYFCENFWWVCLGAHFASAHHALAWWAMGVLVVSDTLDNLWFTFAGAKGMPHPSELGDVDRRFHRIGGRRNIYCAMLLLGLLLQAPWEAYLAVAGWAFLTQLFHAVRIGSRWLGSRA